LSLKKIGVEERKAVNIMAFNSPEWAIAYHGAIFHNNVVSGVYITNGPEACAYQAQNSEAQVICVDTLTHLQLYMGIIDKLPMVKAVVMWGDDKIPEKYSKDSRVYTWKAFLEVGKKTDQKELQGNLERQRPGHCCVLIYTSGTTGNPKGVMLSHDNIIFSGTTMGIDVIEHAPADNTIQPEDMRMVSYLPLSHIAGLQFDLTSHLIFGCQVFFAKPDALQGTLVESL
jgi:long-chain-fatty-acid--CoA ligase ACSBG